MAEKKEKRYVSDNAQLMAEWDWEKNNALEMYPQEITCGSNKKVWWKCTSCYNVWDAQVKSRSKGTGCPNCKGQKISQSKRIAKLNNSLCERFPFICGQLLLITEQAAIIAKSAI